MLEEVVVIVWVEERLYSIWTTVFSAIVNNSKSILISEASTNDI